MVKPTTKILLNGNEVKWKVSSIIFQDEAGIRSDTLTITIADDFKLPNDKATLSLYLGYDSQLSFMGNFIVNKLNEKYPPKKITIHANATDLSSGIKEQKNRNFERIKIGELIEKIATENNLTFFVHQDIASIELSQITQKDESDSNLLTRLADEHNALFSVKNNKVLFLSKDEQTNSNNEQLDKVTIDQFINYSISYDFVVEYSGVKARWHSQELGESFEIIEGKEGKIYTITKQFATEQRARQTAKNKLKSLNRNKKKLDLLITGNTNVLVNSIIFFKNKDWLVQSITHNFSSSGFTSQIKAENQ